MTVTLAKALEERKAELERQREKAKRQAEREKVLVRSVFLKLLEVELPDEVEVKVNKVPLSEGYRAWLVFPSAGEVFFRGRFLIFPPAGEVFLEGRFLTGHGRVYTRFPEEGALWKAQRMPAYGRRIWRNFDNFLDAVLFTEAY